MQKVKGISRQTSRKREKTHTQTHKHTDTQEIRGRNDVSTKPGTDSRADRSSVVCQLSPGTIFDLLKQSKISVGLYFRPGKQGERKTARFFVAPGGKTRKLHTTMRSVKYKFDEIVPRLSILIIPLNGFQNYRERLMCRNDLHEVWVFSQSRIIHSDTPVRA